MQSSPNLEKLTKKSLTGMFENQTLSTIHLGRPGPSDETVGKC